MRIAFASSGKGGLDDVVSERFGRCPTFTIVDVENGEIKKVSVIANPGVRAAGGAGVKASQTLIDNSVDVVVAGRFGPNAMALLQGLGIRTVQMPPIKIKEAIKRMLG